MSTMLQTVPGPETDLTPLRAELDRLDAAVHDLLMRRAEVVGRIAATGVKGRVAMRPGREASIIRRLLARHAGALPATGIVRIWRELIVANTSLQGPFSVAVCDPGPARAFTAVAREHFGPLTPLRAHGSPAGAIEDVSAGLVTGAVLPLPTEGEPDTTAWWTALLHRDEPRVHIVARLPFWAPRSDGAPDVQAFVVSAAAPDPSGEDRSLLGLEVARDTTRAQVAAAMATAGFVPGAIILRPNPGSVAQAMVDVDGFVTDGDPRLAALASALGPAFVLGAYAVPVTGAAA